jgi:hypothetical protein
LARKKADFGWQADSLTCDRPRAGQNGVVATVECSRHDMFSIAPAATAGMTIALVGGGG